MQRKLQRSVTEMRRSVWTRPKASTSGPSGLGDTARRRGRPTGEVTPQVYGSRGPCIPEPAAIERRVHAPTGHQLQVGALLDDAPGVEDEDQVGRLRRRQAVGDGHRGPAVAETLESARESPFRPRVDVAGGLVED